MSNRRSRRRVVRKSDAADIDRNADRPDSLFGNVRAADGEREVILDPEAEESLSAEEFWREQRPPHY
ncbi:hypothetical protein [Corynebacterium sp.]|uniref:hypothetical protein n=1 Tax=Corynebacterium sp. TaxID=1720 RepID=UPI0026E0F32A|nr:hypothetical protein [Corynebacterium sp.]MDO5512682.1 hypothetical protein [Corynebacterium sp.]